MLYCICNYALLCFNDLTSDVCIGMLTERLWMVHIGKHTDVFLKKEIVSTIRTAFYVKAVKFCHALIGFAYADHWLRRFFFVQKRAHLAETNHSKPAFNQSEETLHFARFPALGANCMFSGAWKRGSKDYCFCSCSFVIRIRFHSWEVGSTFEPCRNKICWW